MTRERLYTDQGPRESAFTTFATRHSILWWAIHHHQAAKRSIRKFIETLPSTVQVAELRSPAEVDSFLRSAPGPQPL